MGLAIIIVIVVVMFVVGTLMPSSHGITFRRSQVLSPQGTKESFIICVTSYTSQPNRKSNHFLCRSQEKAVFACPLETNVPSFSHSFPWELLKTSTTAAFSGGLIRTAPPWRQKPSCSILGH
jgi:hypothetical protein